MEGELYNVQEGLEGELGFKGERGYSAYEIAVLHGYEGTEQDWINHFGLDLSGYVQTSDVIDNLTSEYTTHPLSAKQGKVLKDSMDSDVSNINTTLSTKANSSDVYTKQQTYTQEQVDQIIENINGKVLWVNPNNTSGFAGQTVELNLSDYDEIDILFDAGISPGGEGWNNMQFITGRLYKINTDNQLYLGSYSATKVGYYTNSSSVTYIGLQSRTARWRSNGIVFSDGHYFESSSDYGVSNGVLKPRAIIGRKRGIYDFRTNQGGE